MQNIPIKTELGRRIRNAFVAPKGKTLVTFDYSQIELRLAAILSGDEKLIAIFKNGEDVHAAVAAELFHLPAASVTKEMRPPGQGRQLRHPLRDGRQCIAREFAIRPHRGSSIFEPLLRDVLGLAVYLAKTKATAARVGYTTTMFGRKRYFPGINSRLPQVKAQSERMAINAPMQGTQADVIKIAMVRIHDLIKKEFSGPSSAKASEGKQAAIVLQIHDELMFELDDDIVDSFAPQAKAIMESVLTPSQTLGVPITVSGEQGRNWGEMEKI